ncbi:MAG: folate-binding protein [Gallionellales bacterium RBG_16_57_15]|nr:MAG: folate-binding protein [Gallionellales bacterium RBG_16_57_15]
MNPDWQNFLVRHAAAIDSGVTRHFGDAAAELCATAQTTVLCDLSQFGTLRVSGEEAQAFLQNMLSNDIRDVGAGRAQLSSLNTPKGRMVASMLIWRNGDDYLLQLPRALCEPLRKKLGMYVLRAKVKISDASDEIVVLGLSGENAQEILGKQFGELPQLPFGFIDNGQAGVLKFSDTRFQVSVAVQHAPALWQVFSQHAQPVGGVCWDWLTIRAGIPVILPQTQEQFVPQMTNFDLVGGVNFKKGCYPGQEIVARMQYLGKLKRRMYLAHIDGNEAPRPGDELFSADDMEGQASGLIVNATSAPNGGYDMLAVVRISSRETQTVHWKSPQGVVLQFLPLPYPLPQG